jgi:hypothetical protein
MMRMLRIIKQGIGVRCYMRAIRTFCYQLNVVLTISVHILSAFIVVFLLLLLLKLS